MADLVSNIYGNYYTQNDAGSVRSSALEGKLNNGMEEATDEEMLNACKEFEAYLMEQVLKEVKKTIPKSDEDEKDNEYVEYFGDMLVQEYASILTEHADLGIVQTLYEAMKNNMTTVNFKELETKTEVEQESQEEIAPAENINM